MEEFHDDDLSKEDWRFIIKVTIVVAVCVTIIMFVTVKLLAQ